jgi:hypothetical protein
MLRPRLGGDADDARDLSIAPSTRLMRCCRRRLRAGPSRPAPAPLHSGFVELRTMFEHQGSGLHIHIISYVVDAHTVHWVGTGRGEFDCFITAHLLHALSAVSNRHEAASAAPCTPHPTQRADRSAAPSCRAQPWSSSLRRVIRVLPT